MKNQGKLIVFILSIFTLFNCSKDENNAAPNQAPEAFTLIAVTDGAIGVDVKPTFSWNAAVDPEGDTITYELLMDANSNPTTSIANNISGTSFTLQDRLPLTVSRFWKVMATDNAGNTSMSNTFSFTTRNLSIPTTPVTANAAFSERLAHASIVFDGKMWVIGGIDNSALNDVWNSRFN